MNGTSAWKLAAAAAIGGALLLGAGGAQADTILYSAALGNGDPYANFGSGNVNSNWTISQTAAGGGTIELGLRANTPYIGGTLDQGNGTYGTFAPGTFYPNGHPLHTHWNFEFSVDLGNSGLNLADVQVVLGIDTNPGTGTSYAPVTLNDASSIFTDSELSNSSTRPIATGTTTKLSDAITAGSLDTFTVLMNSENPLWLPFFYAASPDFSGYWGYQLQVLDMSGNVLASDKISVNVPEPATVALLGIGLLGLLGISGFNRRRSITC